MEFANLTNLEIYNEIDKFPNLSAVEGNITKEIEFKNYRIIVTYDAKNNFGYSIRISHSEKIWIKCQTMNTQFTNFSESEGFKIATEDKSNRFWMYSIVNGTSCFPRDICSMIKFLEKLDKLDTFV